MAHSEHSMLIRIMLYCCNRLKDGKSKIEAAAGVEPDKVLVLSRALCEAIKTLEGDKDYQRLALPHVAVDATGEGERAVPE